MEDLAEIRSIREAKVSPDGEMVAYLLSSTKLEENKSESDIYVVPTTGGEAVRLTETGKCSMPRWSPDGRMIAFVEREEDGKSAITVMAPDGKGKRKVWEYEVSNASLGVSTVGNTIEWSPDGSRIAFLASLEPYDKDAKVKVITRLQYKAFFGNSDMRRRHIFVVSPLGEERPTQLTFGDYDEHSIVWSPDGKEIAFVSNRTGRADLNMHLDIYAVDVETKEIRRITESVGAEYYPKWSPDGTKIAYTATTRGNTSNESTPEDRHIWVVNSDGGNPRDITGDSDRPCTAPHWSPDGSRIYFTTSDRGKTPICSISSKGGGVIKVKEGDCRYGILDSGAGKIVYSMSDPRTPGDVYSADLDCGNEVKLTDYNGFLGEMKLVWPEEFTFKSSDGWDIQGWLYKPADLDEAKKYPGILSIKGGPSGMGGWSWNSRGQLLAAQGYVQFGVNYRGSSGYGQTFTDAVVEDMLGGEYRDNMEAVDHILSTRAYVDPERLGVYGGSYGGYLTNWIITQTRRFKAAVSISSISNLFSQWGCSALSSWVEVEIKGLPWEKLDLMIKQSPIMQADKARTPTLFIHGEKDHDVPIVEAEQMFAALKKHDVEAVFVRYVEEGHGVRRKPGNQLDVMRRLVAWFDGHL